jgi:hypothetical protein
MKALSLSIAACLALLFSHYALADCGTGRCGSSNNNVCNPYESDCQCSDPICNKPMYSNCISRAYCCEAFGNIGAR